MGHSFLGQLRTEQRDDDRCGFHDDCRHRPEGCANRSVAISGSIRGLLPTSLQPGQKPTKPVATMNTPPSANPPPRVLRESGFPKAIIARPSTRPPMT